MGDFVAGSADDFLAGPLVQFEKAVVDVLATFVDRTLGACGELSEWVDGRVWRFEVNDRLDALRRWCGGKGVPAADAGRGMPEVAKALALLADR